MKRGPGISLPMAYTILGILILSLIAFLVWGSSPSGFSVMTGQAIEEGSTLEVRTLLQCTDSDGRGAVQTAGTVTLTYSDGSKEGYTDVCEGTATIDYACEGKNMIRESYSPVGCSCTNGACIQCLANECNPTNSQQICSNNVWTLCQNNQVCVAGKCETPLTIPTREPTGGGGGSSGGGTITPSPSVSSSEKVISLGTLSSSITQDLGSAERVVFKINSEYTLKPATVSTSGVSFIWRYTSESLERNVFLSVGDEITIDSFLLKLKSVSTLNNKAKIIITPVS
ncbi:MAG: hypothetical protein AABY00_00415 [Nanoarchaeota archaeon]